MASLWLDLRYALRMMWRAPGLTAVLAITLALGIGASTTIFSVVHSVLLEPLPYREPDRLVRVYTEFHGSTELPSFPFSAPEYDDLRRACRSCSSVAAWARGTASLAGGERPVRVDAAWASHTLLPLLGVEPQLGRFFDASEDRPGADPSVVVLSDAIWRRAFAADPAVIGRRITLDAMPVTVIGVMPPGFDFLDRIDAWVPGNLTFDPQQRGGHNFGVIARLADDATIGSLRAELAALVNRWAASAGPHVHTIDPVGHPMKAVPFQRDLVGSLAAALWMLQAAVLFVLLISIVNVANLLLARSESRTREVAVRHAVGASRRRLVRQFLTESLALAVFGGGLGVLVAVWAVDGVRRLLPVSAPRAREIALDGTAIGFALACAVGAAVLFGLAPILHARRSNLHGALKDGSPRTTGSRARLRVRRALVIAEIALAVVLVIGCTVMVRSFVRLQHVELGYRPDHVLAFEIEIPEKNYPGITGDVFWRRLEDRMRGLPDVTAATLLAGMPPVRPINANSFHIPGRAENSDDPPNVDYWQSVGTRAFETLGARIVRGRPILASDTLEAAQVVVINEAFAEKFFPGVDPVGRQVHMRFRGGHTQTIVGVVANIRNCGIDHPPGTEVFFPVYQAASLREPPRSRLSQWVLLRTEGDPEALVPAAYRAMAELDPTLPLSHIQTMDDVVWEAVARPRFLTFLLGSFAAIALLLAAVGIYGVMAHTVAQRTHEIGVRVALGAPPAQVRGMILRQAGGLVAIGIAVGLGAAIALQAALDSALRGLFYGDRLSQPLLLGGVALAIAATALVATWLPVRRATRIEPSVALRSE